MRTEVWPNVKRVVTGSLQSVLPRLGKRRHCYQLSAASFCTVLLACPLVRPVRTGYPSDRDNSHRLILPILFPSMLTYAYVSVRLNLSMRKTRLGYDVIVDDALSVWLLEVTSQHYMRNHRSGMSDTQPHRRDLPQRINISATSADLFFYTGVT